MKRFFAICMLFASATMIGCGDSGSTENIMEGADEAAVLSYDEMVAADEAMMNEDPGDASDDGAAAEAAPE